MFLVWCIYHPDRRWWWPIYLFPGANQNLATPWEFHLDRNPSHLEPSDLSLMYFWLITILHFFSVVPRRKLLFTSSSTSSSTSSTSSTFSSTIFSAAFVILLVLSISFFFYNREPPFIHKKTKFIAPLPSLVYYPDGLCKLSSGKFVWWTL